jgi:putative intracellular protease/amidase
MRFRTLERCSHANPNTWSEIVAKERILAVVTSNAEFPGAKRSTGYWVGEISHFAEVVEAAGFELDIVSPEGGSAPMDPKSARGFQAMDGGFSAYEGNQTLQAKLRSTLRPEDVNIDDYVAIYFAGGHGTMWDFATNEAIARLAASAYEHGKVVSAVCHGVSALLGAKLSNGKHLVDGHAITGFANIEERLMRLSSKVPFLLESELRNRNGQYERGIPFMSHVVVSGRLITGQNPSSTKAVAKKLVELLQPSAAAS